MDITGISITLVKGRWHGVVHLNVGGTIEILRESFLEVDDWCKELVLRYGTC